MKKIYPIAALIASLSGGWCRAGLVLKLSTDDSVRKDAEAAFTRLEAENPSTAASIAPAAPKAPEGTPAAKAAQPRWTTEYLTRIGAEHVAQIAEDYFSDGAGVIEVATRDYIALEDYDRHSVVGQYRPWPSGTEFSVIAASRGSESGLPMSRWTGRSVATVSSGELSTAVYALLCRGQQPLEIKDNGNGTYTLSQKISPYGKLSDCGERCK